LISHTIHRALLALVNLHPFRAAFLYATVLHLLSQPKALDLWFLGWDFFVHPGQSLFALNASNAPQTKCSTAIPCSWPCLLLKLLGTIPIFDLCAASGE